jgi:CCR4-NOT transcription complex subunit 1
VDLDIKPLIIEAHQIGQQELMYVVPFVAKVLESCAKSKVFKPPSPWTMGIMNLLAELHQVPISSHLFSLKCFGQMLVR